MYSKVITVVAASLVLGIAGAAAADEVTQLPMGEVLVTSDAPQLIATASSDDYPMLARRLGMQGTVELRLVVGVDGMPAKVEVVRSSGHRALDIAAVRQAEAFRYRPARANGEPVESYALVPVNFVLADPRETAQDAATLVAVR